MVSKGRRAVCCFVGTRRGGMRDCMAEVPWLGRNRKLHLQKGSCPEEGKWSQREATNFQVDGAANTTFNHLDSRGVSRRELEARVGVVLVQGL